MLRWEVKYFALSIIIDVFFLLLKAVPLLPASRVLADVVGLGGKCGDTGWCYVDEDMSCGDMSPYNGKNISREACPIYLSIISTKSQ